jgi:hypothetical protein
VAAITFHTSLQAHYVDSGSRDRREHGCCQDGPWAFAYVLSCIEGPATLLLGLLMALGQWGPMVLPVRKTSQIEFSF